MPTQPATFAQYDPGRQNTVDPKVTYKPGCIGDETDLATMGSDLFATCSDGLMTLNDGTNSLGPGQLRICARNSVKRTMRQQKIVATYTFKQSRKIYGCTYNGKNDTIVTTENDGTGHYVTAYDKNGTRLWQTAYTGLGSCRGLCFDGWFYYTAVNPTKTAILQKFEIDFINRTGGKPTFRVQKTATLNTDFQSYYGLAFNGLHLLVLTQSAGKNTPLQLFYRNTRTLSTEKIVQFGNNTGTRGIEHDGHANEHFEVL